jgi:hypothetical protein
MSCRAIILGDMKKPLLIISCLLCIYGWGQTNKDSLSIELDKLKATRLDQQAKIETVKTAIIEQMLVEEKIRSGIDKNLMKMDSLTGLKLKLERKKQLTTQQQQQLKKIDKTLDSSSNKLQELDMELSTMISKRRDVLQELQMTIDAVSVMNGKIKELEEMIK